MTMTQGAFGCKKPKRMADGGAVSPFSLKGIARKVGEAADSVAKTFRAPEGSAPAPAAVSTAQSTAQSSAPQLGGVNLGALRRREEAAGLKNGGRVKGPGSGTSDSVPAMLSHGEFVMPADSTAKIGVQNLEAMRRATHTPVRAGTRKKMSKPMMMAEGGLVDDEELRRFPPASDPVSTVTPMRPQPGAASVMAGQAADALRRGVAAAPGPQVLMPGTTAVIRGAGDEAGAQFKAGNYGAAAGQVLRGALALPVAGLDDTVGRAARAAAPLATGVGNALYTAATGENAPAFGASKPPAVPPAVAATAPPMAANPLDQRLAAGVPATSAEPTTASAPSAVPATGTPAPETVAPVAAAPESSADRIGVMQRAGQTYREMPAISAEYDQPGVLSNGSGMRVMGGPDASFFRQVGAKGSAARSETPSLSTIQGGGVTSWASGRRGVQLDRNASAERVAAINAGVSRANSQDSTAAQLAGRRISAGAQLAGQQLQAETGRYGANLQAGTAAQRLALQAQEAATRGDLTKAQAEAARQSVADKKRIDSLQTAFIAETDPGKKAALAEQIRVIAGKDRQDRIITVGGGQVWDEKAGVMRNEPQRAFNAATGQWVEPPAAQPAAPKFETGKVYQDGNGRKAKWDGSKFVPA